MSLRYCRIGLFFSRYIRLKAEKINLPPKVEPPLSGRQRDTKIYEMFKQATRTIILLLYVGDSSRKAREAFSVQKGRTIYPDVLNIREETF